MSKKLLLLISLLFVSLNFWSQDKRRIISGSIIDSLGIVKNANIVNLQTHQGTFSNDDGLFRIFVAIGDSLRVSSIQHKPKKIVISNLIFQNQKIEITLKTATYNLNEFELKRHNLSGRLGIDTKDVPRDKKDSLLRKVMDFSNVDFSEKDYSIDDPINRMKPPIVNSMPNSIPMIGSSVTAIIPFKYSERLWALRKKLALKKDFPYKILSELGEKFFFDELKIPVDNYFHFLEYCNPLGIENLHKQGKLLEVIKILRTESISYLKIIKNE